MKLSSILLLLLSPLLSLLSSLPSLLLRLLKMALPIAPRVPSGLKDASVGHATTQLLPGRESPPTLLASSAVLSSHWTSHCITRVLPSSGVQVRLWLPEYISDPQKPGEHWLAHVRPPGSSMVWSGYWQASPTIPPKESSNLLGG